MPRPSLREPGQAERAQVALALALALALPERVRGLVPGLPERRVLRAQALRRGPQQQPGWALEP
jgi:hypothetical protein